MASDALPLPRDMPRCDLLSASDGDEQAFIDVAGYLTPNTLYLADAARRRATPVKSMPARFDAGGCIVEQFEATSKDGTADPVFRGAPGRLAFDGSAPTLLYGYGGFQVSMTPSYIGGDRQAVAGARRRLCGGQYPRRRRVRAGLARGRR